MSGISYETFEHVADVGVRGKGDTIEDAFKGGAMAMMTVMFDLVNVKEEEIVDVTGSSFDVATLFVEWLNAILTQRDLKGMVFCRFKVEVRTDGEEPMFKGFAWGEPYDPDRHEARTEVKAATYSQLDVQEEDGNGQWVAQCIVDV